MDQAQRRDLIADQLKDTPELSNRHIAASLGVSHHTVGNVRDELVSGGQIAHHEERVGKDGVSQPAKRKPIRTQYIDDTPEGQEEALERGKDIRKQKADPPTILCLHHAIGMRTLREQSA